MACIQIAIRMKMCPVEGRFQVETDLPAPTSERCSQRHTQATGAKCSQIYGKGSPFGEGAKRVPRKASALSRIDLVNKTFSPHKAACFSGDVNI